MDEIISQLEKRIHEFASTYEHIRKKNDQLQQGQIAHLREKEQWRVKHKNAVTQIENMILRLKSIEEPL
jgi:uncharacterized protein (TIGR02449 family)